MSEGGGEALGPPYASTGGFHTSQPPTPSSTVPDSAVDPNSKSTSSSGLPPFSSFTAAEIVAEGLGSRLGPDGYGTETYTSGRILDFPSWSYFDEGLSGRLMDRGDGVPMLVPQTQYTRPWESKPIETIAQDGFTKTYEYPGSPASKLPSFQSQFNSFSEQNGETISLTTLTPAPPSPTTNNSGLPSFHTLSTVTVNPRSYPLVPAPVQAREIPHIQQQFLDERHIQLFQSPTTLNNAQYHQLGLTSTNPAGIIQGNFVTHPQPPQQATLLTVVKTEPVAIVTTQLHQQPNIYQNSDSIMEHDSVKMEENSSSPRAVQDSRKKERRKARASSIETSGESDGVGSSSVESSGQVAAISSTANFKSPLMQHQNMSTMGGNVSIGGHTGDEDCENGTGEKQTKKKRKRCGECIGCQRKDNCGECAPCRNDKSHQICKMRRCEKLTDKKHLLYLQNDFTRTESRRGRGKGTRASYRNKGGRGGGNNNQSRGLPTPQQTPTSGTVTPQPATHSTSGGAILTLNGNDPSPNPSMMTTADHSPGSVMPFYGSNIPTGGVSETTSNFPSVVREHRFPNTVWQQTTVPTDTTTMGTWPPQGQFIQQLPPPQIDDIRYHTQYPPTAPVTVSSYTQPSSGYQAAQNNFLQTNGPSYPTSQPPTVSPLMNGGNTPRTNTIVNGGIDYVEASPRSSEYINGNYAGQENSLVPQPPSTPNSRCSSVQNMDNNTNDSSVGAVIAPSKTPTSVNNYIQPIGTPSQVTNQGNAMPGYPPQQPPQSQQSLHNSSGYPGQNTQSVSHRFIGEDVKPQTFHANIKEEKKEWTSPEVMQNSCQNSSGWSSVNTNGEKHNSPIYQNTTDAGSGTFQNEERTNVNNKLKTMILSKQHANQNHFSQNQQNYHQNEDGQFAQEMHHQNQQFCAPTPSPQSPVQAQQHHVTQNSPSNLPISSQHFQYGSQNRMQQPTPPSQSNEIAQCQKQSYQSHLQQTQQSQQQKNESPEHIQQQQQLHQHQHQQIQQQNQQFQQQMQQLHQQQVQEQQHQQLKHQIQQQQSQNSLQHQQQQVQQQQEQQQQQFSHHYQQQQLQHQQQIQQQQLQQQHIQQQQQHNIHKPDASPKNYYDNQQAQRNSMSPRNESAAQNYQQIQQQKQYLDNFGNKTQMNSNNFLTRGHHPQNLATEGGGSWDFSPISKEENYTNYQDIENNKNKTTGSFDLMSGVYTYQSGERKNDNQTRNHSESELSSTSSTIQSMSSRNIKSNYLKTSSDTNRVGSEPNEFLSKEVPKENNSSSVTVVGQMEVTKSKTEESEVSEKKCQDDIERLKNNIKTEVPECDCFPADKIPSEPGSYYTHLGTAASLSELRQDLENRIGLKGNAIRIEKILYTGKEGKTTQGCPMAKWIIRRSSLDEKVLVVVKHRPGHRCSTAWIVVILVAWEGIQRDNSDQLYEMLVHKLNKFGLPTLRRCATNEPRTCACQGLNPETCGASFSFGCSWSMYYNGCKYARSKTVRKFRLSVRSEEQEVEDRLHSLASMVTPLYQKMAPLAFKNMTSFEADAAECRLGSEEGRPFSGVTACVDFCAHAHRDMHNMNNGLTCVVTLTKHRDLTKADDEQLHVLPLYTIDDTDEFGNQENQLNKMKDGSIEVLSKYECEVRVRSVPLQPCRRHGKKRKDSDNDSFTGRRDTPSRLSPATDGRLSRASSVASDVSHGFDSIDSQLQSSQVSSTVLDSPIYQNWNQNQASWNNVDSDVDNTAIHRSHSMQSVSDPRNQFLYQKANFSPQHTPPNMNLMTSLSPRTPTLLANRPLQNHFSPSTVSDEWLLSSPSNTDQWDYNSPHLRASPYGGNKTPIQRSPNLQSPSVDSFQSPSPNFLKPYPPDKMDQDAISQHYRNTTKVKRDLLDDFKKTCVLKNETVIKSENYKVSVGINTIPDMFSPHFEDKGTSADVNNFTTLPHRTSDRSGLEIWPGINDIILPRTNSSPTTSSTSPFLSHFHYGSNFSEPASQIAAETDSSNQGLCIDHQQYVKSEEKTACYQSPITGTPHNTCQTKSEQRNSCQSPFIPVIPESPISELLGEVAEIVDNEECFKDSQMGGVAIALGHGSVLFECAKHELHATTALKKPDRRQPSRISLVFYQHRNLNRSKHGWEEWEEKTRLKKLGLAVPISTCSNVTVVPTALNSIPLVPNIDKAALESSQSTLHTNTFPTLTWTTLFPTHSYVTSDPFKDKQLTDVR